MPLRDAVIGAIAGYLALWIVYWLFKLIRGKEGMGYGDFKLLAALGAWLGWQMLPLIILLSSVVGAVIGISLMVFKGRDHNVPLAFGPYLAIAGGDRALLRPDADQGLSAVTALRRDAPCFVVGLTGGIGSGKSEVAAAFAALRRRRRSTPTSSRTRSAARGEPGHRAVVEALRRVVRAAPTASSIARALRRRVFDDPAFRARPRAAAASADRARGSSDAIAGLDAGPTASSSCRCCSSAAACASASARVLVVDCPGGRAGAPRHAAQRTCRRRGARDHGDAAAARRRGSRAADDVIDNSAPREALAPQVARARSALPRARAHGRGTR